MADIQSKASQKIEQLLNGIYLRLSKHPQVSEQQRQLMPIQQELMQNLDEGGFLYQSLLRILAIDSYSSAVMSQANLCEDLSGMLAATLQYFNQLGESINSIIQNKQILQRYNKTSQCLMQSIKVVQQMFPRSHYLQDQNKLIQLIKISHKVEQSVFVNIRNQNKILANKLESSELQILNMQNRLTKLLKEHDGCQLSQNINSKMTNIDLRQEISLKQSEIERMNQQFSFQIQKYNTVFQAMKRQLQEMKGYQNIDLIQQIELLQTQIVRLRQERDRDQIIIRQLRNDNTMFSSMGYYSPRQSTRYQTSRFQY